MSEDVTRVVHQEPPDDRGRRDRGGGDGRGWMLATVGLVALLLGVGAGLLLHGDDERTRTVHRTVTAAAETPTTTDAEPATVTHRSVTTIVRTVPAPAETVTVTVPTETATDGEG
jgi:hypothetical protein